MNESNSASPEPNPSTPPTSGPAPGAPSARRTLRRALILCLLALVLTILVSGSIRTSAPPAAGNSLTGGAPQLGGPELKSLRVASYNIHSGVARDGKADLARIAKDLGGYDLIGLNEVRGLAPWRQTDQAELLAAQLSKPWLFAPTERQWWCDSFGNGVITGLPVTHWQRIPLPGTFGRGQRNLLFVKVRLGATPLNVLITHTDRQDDRGAQLRAAGELFLSMAEPAVLMGDFNSTPVDPFMQQLRFTPGVMDPLAQSQGDKLPAERVDWILTRGLKTRAAGLIDSGASDHPLVWADLELPAKP